MTDKFLDIRNRREVSKCINKLKHYLGVRDLNRELARYRSSLTSAGPCFRRYYLEGRHPFWKGFKEYNEIIKKGRTLPEVLSPELYGVAISGRMLAELTKIMPASVAEKYRKNLLNHETARGHLFEIGLAFYYHHYRRCKIEWYEEANSKQPEFAISTGDFSFDLECKTISVDKSRKITRSSFYQLMDLVISQLGYKGLHGRIEIFLTEPLGRNLARMQELAVGIVDTVKGSIVGLDEDFHFGKIRWNLHSGSEQIEIGDLNNRKAKLLEEKELNAHVLIYAREIGGHPTQPLEIQISCDVAEDIIAGIKGVISDAAKNQLRLDRAGVIVCHLPEIGDFSGLDKGGGLHNIANEIFSSDRYRHVSALGFSSDRKFISTNNAIETEVQSLIFRNPNSKFRVPADFKFIGEI